MDVFLHNQRLKSQLGSIHLCVCVFFFYQQLPFDHKGSRLLLWTDAFQSFWMALHYRAVIDRKQCSAVKEQGALGLITAIILLSKLQKHL